MNYYSLNAQFHEWIEAEVLEAPISRALLHYKASKRFGFGAKKVDKAVNKLIEVGVAIELTPGLIQSKRSGLDA